MRNHLSEAAKAALNAVDGLQGADLVQRVLDVADAARDRRWAADDAGQPGAASRASDAELRALSLLTDRLGVSDTDVVEQLEQAQALARAVGLVTRLHPEVGHWIAARMKAMDGQEEFAGALEAHAANFDSRSEEEVTR